MTYSIKNQNDPTLLNYCFVLGMNKSTNGCYYEYKGFNEHKEVNDELKKKKALYELITGRHPIKPYIDYDDSEKIKNKKGLKHIKEVLKPHTITRLCNIFIQGCINIGIPADKEQLLIIDGSRIIKKDDTDYYKLSFHITLNNKYVFKNTYDILKVFVPALERSEQELYNDGTYYKRIDKRVYGKTQRLRTIYSHKYAYDKDDILQPIDTEGEIIKEVNEPILYLVQYFENDYIYINNANTETNEHKEVNEQKPIIINKNVYTQDIIKLLIKNGMTTAHIPAGGIKKSTKTNNIYYDILYNPKVNKCIYGKDDHDRPTRGVPVCYAYIFNGCCYVGCRGQECQKKEKVNIGSILERSPLYDELKAHQITERYLTQNKNNKVNQLCQEFIKNESYKALIIKSETGTGKTYLLKEYINMYDEQVKKGSRILLISTRQSYARAMCQSSLKELNIINYLDYREDKKTDNNKMYELPRLCISMEGLQSLMMGTWKPYDIIILDESESIARHLYSSTVKSGSYGVFVRIRQLIEYSKKCILLDADAGTPTMTIINDIEQKNIMMINNNFMKDPKNYFMTKDKEGFINELKANIVQDIKQYIVCLSKNEADALERILRHSHTNEKQLLLITAESDTKTKKQLSDVNTLWSNYYTVITTSTTGAGVDYNKKDYFNKVYGYVNSGSCPPVEFIQILDRVRYPTTNNIKILLDSSLCIPDNDTFIYTVSNAKYYIDDLNKNTDISNVVNMAQYCIESDMVINKDVYTEKNKDYTLLTYYNYLTKYLNNSPSNYVLYLKLLLEQRGHMVIIDDEKYKQTKNKTAPHEQYNDIKLNGMTGDDIQKIYNQQEKTTAEQQKLKKVETCNRFGIHKSKRDNEEIKQIIDIWHKPVHKSAIKLILKHFVKDAHIDIVMNSLKEYDDENDKIRQNKMNLFNRLINIMKYDYTDNFKIDINEMTNIIKEYKTTPTERKSISRTQLDEYKTIQTILKKYGLTLTKTYTSKRTEEGKKQKIVNGYNIKHDDELYKCIYLIVKKNQMNKFKDELLKMCNIHNQYDVLTINNRLI